MLLTDDTRKFSHVGRQQTWQIHCKQLTVAISKRRIHILGEISRISLFSLLYGTILTFIKFNNFGTRCSNEPRPLFHSFYCTTQHIFEPLHIYESSFTMDKYSMIYLASYIVNQLASQVARQLYTRTCVSYGSQL